MQYSPKPISVGSKKYSVGIASTREWTSASGAVRTYLEIGKPGIHEVANAYISHGPATTKGSEFAIQTAAGLVIVEGTARPISGAKIAAIKQWFIDVLSN